MPDETDKWREENEKRIRAKLGMAENAPTGPDYWREWDKVARERESRLASATTYQITDDELANYPSYGWPLRCSFCGFGVTLVKA